MVSDEMKGFFKNNHLKILKELEQQGIILTKELTNTKLEEVIENIIQATSYKQRKENFPNACPCYQPEIGPCSKLELLNCFLCGCPKYDLTAESGGCQAHSRLGKWAKSPNFPNGKIWDCSSCNDPHYPTTVKTYIQDNLDVLIKMQEQL